MLENNLRLNRRTGRLEGALLGLDLARSGRAYAYQGELVTGEIATVYWTGYCRNGEPELRLVDQPARQVSGAPASWRWFNHLAAVDSVELYDVKTLADAYVRRNG